jgi:hypothetical protein
MRRKKVFYWFLIFETKNKKTFLSHCDCILNDFFFIKKHNSMEPLVLVSNREENRMRKNLSEILKDALNARIKSSNVEVSL